MRRRHGSHVDRPQPLVPGGHAIAVVAQEQLVAALAGQHHLHVLARQPRHEVERHARGEGDRLVLVPDETRQRLEELRSAMTTTSRCSAPTAVATRRAYWSSLASRSSNADGKVRIGSIDHPRHQGGQRRSNRCRRRETARAARRSSGGCARPSRAVARRSLARSSRRGWRTVRHGRHVASSVALAGLSATTSRACDRAEACRCRGRTSPRRRRSAWRGTRAARRD